MSSPSIVTKVIFAQKIIRFACRNVTDLGIVNNVCRDFEETMQAHHTFNLVLYDNVIKKKHDDDEFLYRCANLLSTAPSWVLYQWTVVNEHDEVQRELLKELLLYQAPKKQALLLREYPSNEHPTTNCQLVRRILDSCVELGIAKEVLESIYSYESWNCIMIAIQRRLPSESFTLILEFCVQHADIKKLLEQTDDDRRTSIAHACNWQLNAESFEALLEIAAQHINLQKSLEQPSRYGRNSYERAIEKQFPAESLKLLLDCAVKHGNFKEMLQRDVCEWNCIWKGLDCELPLESFSVLLEYTSQHADLKQMLEERDGEEQHCLFRAIKRGKLPIGTFELLLQYCAKHTDIKQLLEHQDNESQGLIFFAIQNTDPVLLKVLLEFCLQHADLKKMLEQQSPSGKNRIDHAAANKLPAEPFKILLDFCLKHADVKKMLGQLGDTAMNCLMHAVYFELSVDSFKILLEFCLQHGDIKKMLEQTDDDGWNIIFFVAVKYNLPIDFFNILLEHCAKYANLKKLLEQVAYDGATCLSLAASKSLPYNTIRRLIAHFPSEGSFQKTATTKDADDKVAADHATDRKVKFLLKGPDCWSKCREYCASNGITLPAASAAAATRSTTNTQQQQQQSSGNDQKIQQLEFKLYQQEQETQQLKEKLAALTSAVEKLFVEKLL